jgi:hypothetical protein
LKTIVNDDSSDYVDSLFSVVSRTTPLDNYLAGYFEKILEVLFRTNTSYMINYVNNRGQALLEQFLHHIKSYSIMQIVQRLLLPHIPFHSEAADKEEDNSQVQEQQQCQWSYHFETCQSLVSMMVSSTDHDIINHISDLLITILQLSPADAPILHKFMCSPEMLLMLWGALYGSQSSDSTQTSEIAAVSVLECLLSRLYETAATAIYDDSGQVLLQTIKSSFQNILAGVKNCLPHIKSSIDVSTTSEVTILNQNKENVAVLGQLNFFYTKLIEGLLRLGDEDVDICLCESGILNSIIDLMFKFKNHSMLHLSVQRILLVILEDCGHRKYDDCSLIL